MKKAILLTAFFIVAISLNEQFKAQICKASNMAVLIQTAQKDKNEKIERLAATKFHKLINDYRKEKKLAAIDWDDALWLASRNHNFWMDANATLSHEEKKGTKCFSGSKPGSRYMYATAGKGLASWSGENILYHYDLGGRTVNEAATNIANKAFKIWQNSPGHDQNMLGESHKAHGVAFHLSKDGRVYGTDLFASSLDDQFCVAKAKNKKKA